MSQQDSPVFEGVIDTYCAKVYPKIGPGVAQPTPTEIASFYPVWGMVETQPIEIYMSQGRESSLTDPVRQEVSRLNKRIRGRNGRTEDAISIKPYNSANLKKKLEQKNDGVKRIFINDETTMQDFVDLLKSDDSVSLLRGNRFFTASIPQSKDDVVSSVNQAWLIKVAILSCLINEENAQTAVGNALRDELSNALAAEDINSFVANLAKSDDPAAGIGALRSRADYFLGKIVRLSTVVAEQLRLLKAFWTAA